MLALIASKIGGTTAVQGKAHSVAASARFVVSASSLGTGRSTSVPLEEDEILIGRDPGCLIVLAEMTVSRKHARLSRHPDGHYLEDLGSTAGTRINGQLLHAPERLRGGDVVTVGECSLTYVESEVGINEGDPSEDVILKERGSSGTIEGNLIGVLPEKKLAAILGLARTLGGGLDLDEVLGNVLDVLFRVFARAERGIILLDGGDGPRPAAIRSRDGRERPTAVSRTVYEHVTRGGKAILVQDVRGDERFSGSRSVDEARIRTIMAVPLRDHEKRVVGLLQMDTSEPGAGFEAADLDLLSAIAVHVGLAVDNARLLDASRQRVEATLAAGGGGRSIRRLARLDRHAQVSRSARRAPLGGPVHHRRRDEDGAIRRVAASHADPPHSRWPIDSSIIPRPVEHAPGDASDTRRPSTDMSIEVTETETQVESFAMPTTWQWSDRLACKSHLCVPMAVRGRTLGVISFVGTRSSRKHEPRPVLGGGACPTGGGGRRQRPDVWGDGAGSPLRGGCLAGEGSIAGDAQPRASHAADARPAHP